MVQEKHFRRVLAPNSCVVWNLKSIDRHGKLPNIHYSRQAKAAAAAAAALTWEEESTSCHSWCCLHRRNNLLLLTLPWLVFAFSYAQSLLTYVQVSVGAYILMPSGVVCVRAHELVRILEHICKHKHHKWTLVSLLLITFTKVEQLSAKESTKEQQLVCSICACVHTERESEKTIQVASCNSSAAFLDAFPFDISVERRAAGGRSSKSNGRLVWWVWWRCLTWRESFVLRLL